MKVVKDPMFCSRNPYSTAVMATDTFTVIELDSEESEVDELDEDRVCLGNGIPVLLPTQMATDTSTVIELDRDESEVYELDENRVCLGNEIPILLDIEQSLKQRLLRRTPEQDLLISQWCRDTKQIFEKWNLDFKTILVLFDVSALRNSEADRLKIVRARDVENINESTPVYVLSKVIAAHTQAEVLLQLRHEYDQFEYGCNFDAGLFDSFYVKCQKITSLWGWSESLSYSILSKLFDNL